MQTKSLLFLFLSILCLNFPSSVFAHGESLSFQTILNGYPTVPSEISTTEKLEEFTTTEDIASTPFRINQPISFEINHDNSENHPKFTWKFSDGQSIPQESGDVSFQKPGSYIATVTKQTGEETDTHTILLHVIPKEGYTLPVSGITINDTIVPLNEAFDVDLSKPQTFHATGNEKYTYIWNFDNGDIRTGSNVTYEYENHPFLVSPILRVIDENGLYTDTQISLKNSTFGKKDSFISPFYVGVISIATIIFGAAIAVIYIRKNRLKK